VKNRVDPVMSLLPELVRLEGVVVTPVQPSMLMYVNLYSTDPNANETFLYNFAMVHLVAELRIHGLGRVTTLGYRQYAMRIWLRPDRMRAYNVSIDDVMEAIAEQSIIGRPGRTGQASGMTAQSIEYVLTYMGRYDEPEEYENIIIRATSDGEIYAILQTPPGTTLERTNEITTELQNIAREIDGVESVSALAGYEILTEGRGSNAGTCLINLRPWSERTSSVHDVVETLEERTRDLGATVEFFEPPSVPGYGAADGFAMRLLDRGETTDYQEFDRINTELMDHARSYELQREQVDRLEASVELSNLLFNAARAEYLEVLTARRDYLEAQLELVETKRRQLSATVTLYQALGGGWRSSSTEADPEPMGAMP